MAAIVPDCAGMTQLSGKTIVSVNHFSVNHDTAADSGSKSDHNEMVHTLGGSVGHLTHCGGIGVICQADRNSAQKLSMAV